ncbi:MAG: UvrD-helicase domain-containing protein [Thermoguttaceae bacterium]|nr:UvrD-helicase domain-containing protein [Thermoguttaceae bacterium]
MKSNLLIRASAGSGKTRQLSLRYLELIASGVPIPRILASTFTRKATGEILNRILLSAAQACRDDALRNELSQNIGREISSKEMEQLMRQLVMGLNQIRACSLDGFFTRIAFCFPYEMGLKPGWMILDDVDDVHLRWNAIQKTLRDNRKNAPTLVRQLFKGENRTQLANEISEQIRKLLSLKREADENAWNALMDPTIWVPGEKTPFAWFLNEAEIVEILNCLEEEAEKASENPDGKKNLLKALNKIIPQLRINDWVGLANEKTIQNAFQADSNGMFLFYGHEFKFEELRLPLIRLARHCAAMYFRLMQEQTHAVYELMDGFSAHYDQSKLDANGLRFEDLARFTAKFIEKLNGNLQPLFWRMNSSIDHLLLDEFQDTSLDQWRIFLPFGKHCTAGNGRTFFCVGDVKQAIYRWRNGRSEIFNAIENTFPGIEQESSNTSWRSAPEILHCVNRFFHDPVKDPSAPQPDPFACGIDGVPLRSLLDKTASAAWDDWRFETHKVSPKSAKYPGYWELRTMCEGKSKSKNGSDADAALESDADPAEDPQLQWTADQIAEIYRNAGGIHRIGVLFRTNSPMPKLAHLLRKKGIPVSEEGKIPLTTSTAVRLLLSLLSLMDFPDSSMDWFYVGNSPLAERFPELAWKELRLIPQEEAAEIQTVRSRCLAQLRERFQAFGIGTFLEELVRFLEPRCTKEEVRRLQQFLNLAAAFTQNSRSERIADFVTYIKTSGLEDPSDAAVSLMTIHKSKGLQFDAVVLPELNFEITGKSPNFVPGYPQDDVLQAVSLVTPVPNKEIKKAFFSENSPILKAMMHSEKERANEAFSMLYVAMTRAVYAMYLFVPPSSSSSKSKGKIPPKGKASDLLRITFTGEEAAPPEARLVWDGDAQWYLKTPQALAEEEKTKTLISENAVCPESEINAEINTETDAETYTAGESSSEIAKIEPILFKCDPTASRNLTRRAPSNIEDRRFVDLGKKIDFSQQNTVNGSILHSWYEKIAWVENSLPSDEELIAAAKPFGLAKERLERLLKSFHNSLKAPKLHRVLHWTTYLPMLREKVLKAGILTDEQIPKTVTRKDPADPNEIRWEVYCEKELAIRTEDELLLGTLDRLILLRNDAEIFWADCIDYKTTRKVSSPEALEEKIRSHQLQMEDYRKMLQLHYRIPESRISTHLVFSMLGVVREV